MRFNKFNKSVKFEFFLLAKNCVSTWKYQISEERKFNQFLNYVDPQKIESLEKNVSTSSTHTKNLLKFIQPPGCIDGYQLSNLQY